MEGEDMRTILRAMAATAACVITLSVSGLATDAADAAEPGLESQYVAAVNQVRANAGLPPLAVHGELTGVARGWADTMASANEIWHNPNLGSAVSAPWLKLGENVGTGYDVAVVMDAFVNSPAHYRNLVDPAFDHIGVGVTYGSDGRMYTAHVFMDLGADSPAAAPAPAPAPARERTAAPAPAVEAPAPAAPPAPTPPPAAAEPERVATVLTLVGALDGGLH